MITAMALRWTARRNSRRSTLSSSAPRSRMGLKEQLEFDEGKHFAEYREEDGGQPNIEEPREEEVVDDDGNVEEPSGGEGG